MNAAEAYAELRAVLEPLGDADPDNPARPRIRLHPYGAPVQPPGTVIGPPKLTWRSYSEVPTEATFTVFLVAAFDDRAVDRLLEMLPLVHAAVESTSGAAVGEAQPTTYVDTSGTQLPAYALPVLFALS